MRKLLIVLLALTLVFACAGAALAAGDVGVSVTTPNPSVEIAANGQLNVSFTGTAAADAGSLYYKLVLTGAATGDSGVPASPIAQGDPISLSATSTAISETGAKSVTWKLYSGADSGTITTEVATGTITAYVGSATPGAFTITAVSPESGTVSTEEASGTTKTYHVTSTCPSVAITFTKAAEDIADPASPFSLSLSGTTTTKTVTVTPENRNPAKAVTYTIKIVRDYELAGLSSIQAAPLPTVSNPAKGTEIAPTTLYYEESAVVANTLTLTGEYFSAKATNPVAVAKVSGAITGTIGLTLPAGTSAKDYEIVLTGDGATPFAGAVFSVTVTPGDGTSAVYYFKLTKAPTIAVSGDVYKSSSATGTSKPFTFAAGDTAKTVTIPSDWDLEVDEDYVYIEFDAGQDIDTVKYTTSSSSTGGSEVYDDGGVYRIPIDSLTMYVNIKLDGSATNYKLTLDIDEDAAFTVKVSDSRSTSGAETVSFPGTPAQKSVTVDEDWDNDTVYLKFSGTASKVDDVEYAYKTSGSKEEAEEDGGYYEVELDGTTYVWFEYDGEDYRLTIKPDGSTSTELLIDSLEANSEDDGDGDDYLAFFDSDGGKIYVFRPYSNRSDEIWLNIEADGDVCYGTSTTDKEGDWVKVHTGSSLTIDTVTVDDEEFEIVVYTGKSSADDDADLNALSVKAGTKSSSLSAVALSPSFSSGTRNYTAGIGSNTYAQITAKLSDSSAYMVIDGYGMFHTSSSKSWNFSGLSTKTNSFKYTIYVIAEDCEEYETYTVTLSRSGSATLKSLSVSGGTLTPSFAAKTLSYTAYTSGSSTTISAVADDSNASVTIYGYSAANASLGSQSGTGSAYGSFNLAEGLNTFTVTVKSGSTITTYYVSMYRIPASPKIVVSKQSITVNGTAYSLAAYNINGNNFVKLRDLAALLANTGKKFSVDFNDSTQTATMVSGGNYVKRGDELTALPAYKKYTASTQRFILDSNYIYPMAFNIDGTNYVMIRDMGSAMNFYVGYTASTKTIVINTGNNYVPN